MIQESIDIHFVFGKLLCTYCVRMCLRACVRTCARACVRACVRGCVRVCVCVSDVIIDLFNSMLLYVINRLMHAFLHIRTVIIPRSISDLGLKPSVRYRSLGMTTVLIWKRHALIYN